MAARICEYLKSDGNRCSAVALRGRDYCRHHVGGARPREREEAQRAIAPPFELPELDDYSSIHRALTLVMNAILNRRIEAKPAGQLLYALQLTRTNLDHAWDYPEEEVGAIQLTLMEVMRDLLHRRIGTREAGQVLFAVQMTMKNLKDGIDFPPEEGSEVAGYN